MRNKVGSITKFQLRDAARTVLLERGYSVIERTIPGVGPGARLLATKNKERLRISVRTSQNRQLGLVKGPEDTWQTGNADCIIMAVPTRTVGCAEVMLFDVKVLTAEFNKRLRKEKRMPKTGAPVFMALDDTFKRSSSRRIGLKHLAKWIVQFDTRKFAKEKRQKEFDDFVARATQEFADLVGVERACVKVDFRISSGTNSKET
jgi:hypothetical protein